ncbi:MAG: Anti-sigma factor antagonist [Klenkia sp.]|nr:Anti-sigma factor antagonist [Klenkia sp.]
MTSPDTPPSESPVDAHVDVAPEVSTSTPSPGVTCVTVVGELTAEARKPLIRVVTDLLLGAEPPKKMQLDLHGVTFLNSAGLSTVVQVHRMLEGRGSELQLLVGSTAVARPLQLSGLWHRFQIVDGRHTT